MQREHEHHAHKGGNKGTFNLIFGVLVIITVLEIAVSELDGLIGHALLIGLTTAKGGFVVAYYMHLKYDPPILTWIFVVPIIMAAAMIISLQGLAGYDLVR